MEVENFIIEVLIIQCQEKKHCHYVGKTSLELLKGAKLGKNLDKKNGF